MSIKSSFPTDSPSLVLDFANSRRLDPRITFTRAATGNVASYMGPDGLVKYAGPNQPRFDHRYVARTNLIPYSEDFSTAWSSGEVTITTNQIANPLTGAITADKYVATTTLDRHRVQQSIGSEIGIEYTGSVYVKSAGVDTISLRIGRSSNVDAVVFNILSGVVISEGSSITSSSIENVGNGWFRVTITNTPAIVGTQYFVISEDEKTGNFSGDGVSGLYFWGAQLEKNDTVTTYIPTTSAAATESYMESLGLLLEESRVNLFKYSEDYTQSDWFKGRVFITANATTAPDGTQTADLLTENNTSTGEHYLGQVGFNYTSGQSYTWSWYVKPNGRTNVYCKVYANFNNTQAILNLDTGSVYYATTEQFDNTTYERLSNGWYKVSFTKTASSTGQGHILLGFANSSTTYSYLGDNTSGMYYWGAQVEVGSFPTSYIPTNGSAVTRNSASITLETSSIDFSDPSNNGEGTLICEFTDSDGIGSNISACFSGDSHNGATFLGIGSNSNFNPFIRNRVNGVNYALIEDTNLNSSSDFVKVGYLFSQLENTIITSSNHRDTDSNIQYDNTPYTKMIIGRDQIYTDNNIINGTMKKISYYPIRLSNAQLQELTK